MKAVLFAAGRGARLRPFSDSVPKCLVPIQGRPLLDYWLELCERAGVTDVLVNGHYLASHVDAYLHRAGLRTDMTLTFVRERMLRGTGGTLRENAEFVRGEDVFLAAHADNFTDVDLRGLLDFHASHPGPVSLALFRAPDPTSCGVVESMEPNGRITRFVEKPEVPRSDLASAAIFALAPEVIERIPRDGAVDFSRDVLPDFAGEMYGWEMPGFNIDVGTPASYARACERAARGLRSEAPEGAREASER